MLNKIFHPLEPSMSTITTIWRQPRAMEGCYLVAREAWVIIRLITLLTTRTPQLLTRIGRRRRRRNPLLTRPRRPLITVLMHPCPVSIGPEVKSVEGPRENNVIR